MSEKLKDYKDIFKINLNSDTSGNLKKKKRSKRTLKTKRAKKLKTSKTKRAKTSKTRRAKKSKTRRAKKSKTRRAKTKRVPLKNKYGILELSINGGDSNGKSTNDNITDENKECAREVSKDENCNTGCIGPLGGCCECNKILCRICSNWKERWSGSPNISDFTTDRGLGVIGPIGMKYSGKNFESVPYVGVN